MAGRGRAWEWYVDERFEYASNPFELVGMKLPIGLDLFFGGCA